MTMYVKSYVTFKKLTKEMIDDYLKTDEPYDKAGSYAIQGEGRSLIEGYSGSLDNIIGLPIEYIKYMLRVMLNEVEIGNVEIENQLVLAPMAGITNEAFRSICKEMGAGLVVCEMISDKALSFHNAKTIKMTGVSQNEHPLSMQIFGADKETLVYAAKWIYENTDADIIDINMGCPVNKVAKRAGAGSSLLRDPNKVYEITKAVVEATPLPVTVKIRIGWDENNINAVENAK